MFDGIKYQVGQQGWFFPLLYIIENLQSSDYVDLIEVQ